MSTKTAGIAEKAVRGMTRAELLAQPAVIDIEPAGRAFGLGRNKSYELARTGCFPVRVLKLGRRYRVITADILALLGINPQEND